jgi:hypothetical protein
MASEAVNALQDSPSLARESRPAPSPHERYLYGLAAVVVLGFFALTVTMVLTDIPAQSQNIAYMLLGGLVTGFSMVLSYFFGSSAGSATKTAQLAELVKQCAPPQAEPRGSKNLGQ